MPVLVDVSKQSRSVVSAVDPQRADARHSFLPIDAVIEVFGGSSLITLTSPSHYVLDILVRIGSRAFLVELVSNGEGAAGTKLVPEVLNLPADISLLACLREGDEQ